MGSARALGKGVERDAVDRQVIRLAAAAREDDLIRIHLEVPGKEHARLANRARGLLAEGMA